jgi:hypothetical protein
MYKVYILKKTRSGSEVIKESRTNTPSAQAAAAAFWDLRNNKNYQGKSLLLLMTKNKEKMNRHWFNRHRGDEQFISQGTELRLN